MKDAKDYRGFDFLFLTGKFNVNNGAFRVVETDLVELRLESKYKLSQDCNIGKIDKNWQIDKNDRSDKNH